MDIYNLLTNNCVFPADFANITCRLIFAIQILISDIQNPMNPVPIPTIPEI